MVRPITRVKFLDFRIHLYAGAELSPKWEKERLLAGFHRSAPANIRLISPRSQRTSERHEPIHKVNEMNDKQQKKTASSEKHAANRNPNGSTGPRTPKGKQRASQNSYKHGFYALRLFPNNELIARDGEDYKRILAWYRSHYSPVGDVEMLYVETIAVHSLRLARLLSHEQEVLGWRAPFEARSVDKIMRYESNVSRRLEKASDQLRRLQEARKAESNQNTDEANDEGFEAPKEPMPEEPQDGSGCSNLPDAPLTTAPPHVETNAKQVSAPTEAEPSIKPAEPAANNPPPREKCGPNAGAQTLAKAIEQAMDPTPAEQHKSGLGSRESYETDRIGSSRFVETQEDAEMIERTKRGDDLEDLE